MNLSKMMVSNTVASLFSHDVRKIEKKVRRVCIGGVGSLKLKGHKIARDDLSPKIR